MPFAINPDHWVDDTGRVAKNFGLGAIVTAVALATLFVGGAGIYSAVHKTAFAAVMRQIQTPLILTTSIGAIFGGFAMVCKNIDKDSN